MERKQESAGVSAGARGGVAGARVVAGAVVAVVAVVDVEDRNASNQENSPITFLEMFSFVLGMIVIKKVPGCSTLSKSMGNNRTVISGVIITR
jgi:hypothetical protein